MRKNKILLIEPPFYRLFKNTYSLTRYPLSLAYLAETVRRNTPWDVVSYNADFNPENEPIRVGYMAGEGFKAYRKNLNNLSSAIWREIRSVVSELRPDAVGISAKSQNFASACNIARIAKELNKDMVVVIGGPHPSMVKAEALKCPDIDICIKGEGEGAVTDLLNAVSGKMGLADIKGIIYRDGGNVVENKDREFINDLDSLPFAYEHASELLRDYNKYPPEAFGYAFTTRGCPYNCFFCGSRHIWGRRVRCRSIENVIEEIGLLRKRGIDKIQFLDDIFGVSKKHITELCGAIARNAQGLKWSCELHVKLVDEKLIVIMKKAGCVSIQLGIESGNNDILRRIRKQITIEDAMAASRIIRKHGISIEAFFMIGFPYDTESTIEDTIKAMTDIKSDELIYSIFTPYPGTEAFEFCKNNGVITDDYDVSLYNHQSPANSFCAAIPRKRFREIASRVESVVDRKNRENQIRRLFSMKTIGKIRESGFLGSVKKGLRIFSHG